MEWSNVYSLKQLGDFLKQRRKARDFPQKHMPRYRADWFHIKTTL